MLTYLAPLLLLLNGLAAGVLFGTQLGGFPYMASLPTDRYVHAHTFFGQRYDPAMPICLVGTVVLDIALAIGGEHGFARVLFALAGLLAAATAAISLTKNAPVNRWMRTLDPDNLPADFQSPRREWGIWNRRRSWLTIAALAVNCAALGFLL
ncbi:MULTISPECIES: anthrone oxygenase family protein [unclassified Streptomyces]|uniref:anthrone oxygenase family protein n=1 Tax=unclassified Streptomyces TaxID=2593676 RepID=UPI0035D6C413